MGSTVTCQGEGGNAFPLMRVGPQCCLRPCCDAAGLALLVRLSVQRANGCRVLDGVNLTSLPILPILFLIESLNSYDQEE